MALGPAEAEVQLHYDHRRRGLTTAEKACMRRFSYASAPEEVVGKLSTWVGGGEHKRRSSWKASSTSTETQCGPTQSQGEGGPLTEIEKVYGEIVERLLPVPQRKPTVAAIRSRPSSKSMPSLGRRRNSTASFSEGPTVGSLSTEPATGSSSSSCPPREVGSKYVGRHVRWDPENPVTQNVIRLVRGASANKIERDVGGKIRFIHGARSHSTESDLDPESPDSPLCRPSEKREKGYTVARGNQELQGHPLHQFRRRMFKAYPSALAAFDAIKVDGNKSLDMREWCEITARWGLCTMFEARVIFELMDANRDGTLTLYEFQTGLEAVTPVMSLAAVRKRLVCLGFESMLQAIAVMDGPGEDTTCVPLTQAEFGAALRRAYIIEDREHKAIFNLVRDPFDSSGRASLIDLAAGLAAVSPCLLVAEARQQLVAKWGSIPAAFSVLEDRWLSSPDLFERYASSWMGLSKAEAAKVFRFTDIDRSGNLSRSELLGVLSLSAPSVVLEDIRRKVQQSYRGIEIALREGITHKGEELDDELRFSAAELFELLEPVRDTMGEAELQHLTALVVSTSEEGGVTLSEFFRGVRLLAPSCCLEGLRLQILACHERIADAFRGVQNRREPLTEEEMHELLCSIGVHTTEFSMCFDLIDVRSTGQVTLSEFMAALQGAQSGTRKWIGAKEREESVQNAVREEFAAVRGNLSDLKTGIRRGYAGQNGQLPPLRKAKDAEPSAQAHKDSTTTEKVRLLVAAPGGGLGPAARKRCIARAANQKRPEPVAPDSMPGSPSCNGDRDLMRTTFVRQTFQQLSTSMKDIPEQHVDIREKTLSQVKDYLLAQKKVFNVQEPILKKKYSKAGLHHEITELQRLERLGNTSARPTLLRSRSGLGQSSSAPVLLALPAITEPPLSPPTNVTSPVARGEALSLPKMNRTDTSGSIGAFKGSPIAMQTIEETDFGFRQSVSSMKGALGETLLT